MTRVTIPVDPLSTGARWLATADVNGETVTWIVTVNEAGRVKSGFDFRGYEQAARDAAKEEEMSILGKRGKVGGDEYGEDWYGAAKTYGDGSSAVERPDVAREVTGSNPVRHTQQPTTKEEPMAKREPTTTPKERKPRAPRVKGETEEQVAKVAEPARKLEKARAKAREANDAAEAVAVLYRDAVAKLAKAGEAGE